MAPKRGQRRKSCRGKFKYPNIQAARDAIRAMRNKGKISGTMDAYRCQHCGGTHIGHATAGYYAAHPDLMR